MTLVNQIKGLGFKVSEEEVASKILRNMAPICNYVVTTIKEARDITKMAVNELTCSL